MAAATPRTPELARRRRLVTGRPPHLAVGEEKPLSAHLLVAAERPAEEPVDVQSELVGEESAGRPGWEQLVLCKRAPNWTAPRRASRPCGCRGRSGQSASGRRERVPCGEVDHARRQSRGLTGSRRGGADTDAAPVIAAIAAREGICPRSAAVEVAAHEPLLCALAALAFRADDSVPTAVGVQLPGVGVVCE